MADIDIGKLSESINNKADRDIGNLTTDGYVKGSGLGMPSSKCISLTLGSSGSTYTAPANGWLQVSKRGTAAGQYIAVYSHSVANVVTASGNGAEASMIIPLHKGWVFTVGYSTDGTTERFQFIYAEGEQ